MAYNKNDRSGMDASSRPPMVQGNWKCSKCGADITQLPFEPAPDRAIYCKDCWSKRRDSSSPRQMVQGNWKCSDCGTEITQLPFEPAPDRQIYCRNCWSKRQNER